MLVANHGGHQLLLFIQHKKADVLRIRLRNVLLNDAFLHPEAFVKQLLHLGVVLDLVKADGAGSLSGLDGNGIANLPDEILVAFVIAPGHRTGNAALHARKHGFLLVIRLLEGLKRRSNDPNVFAVDVLMLEQHLRGWLAHRKHHVVIAGQQLLIQHPLELLHIIAGFGIQQSFDRIMGGIANIQPGTVQRCHHAAQIMQLLNDGRYLPAVAIQHQYPNTLKTHAPYSI